MFARDVARALEEHGVEHCVVGGLAVNLYGIPRATYDVDIVVRREVDPLRRCREALEGLGLRCRLPLSLEALAGESDEALRARNLISVTFTDPNDPLREVDVLVAPPVPAGDLIARSCLMEGAEIALRVVALEDLVALKRAAGREQDLADVRHLERLLPRRRS
ncbi:MAG TPA: nucleotidyl transferase AbiEii/AbiGii toxin family protein [Sandaracinaceae bacterium]